MKILIALILFITSNFFTFNEVRAELDPKVKVIATMSAYGTAGGALLGLASMAFKSNGRAIFQGASIGLWAGLLFGSYVVISHTIRQSRSSSYPSDSDEPQYPDNPQSPYQESSEGDDYSYNPYWIKHEFKLSERFISPKERINQQMNTFSLELMTLTF